MGLHPVVIVYRLHPTDLHRRLHLIFTSITVGMSLFIGLFHETWCEVTFGQCFVEVIFQDPILDGLWIDNGRVRLLICHRVERVITELIADIRFRAHDTQVGTWVVDCWLFLRTTPRIFHQLLASLGRLAWRLTTDPQILHVFLHFVFDSIKSSQEETSLGCTCDVATFISLLLRCDLNSLISRPVTLSGGRQRANRLVYLWQEWWQFHCGLLQRAIIKLPRRLILYLWWWLGRFSVGNGPFVR